ncbi:hypothetical protein CRE_28858 [Caenorhabditis remanei]|uniref:Uncharacterized protein n=1 Tax=Caenorhabditis remanei TaxID=31234 RepID=E3MXH0_CAERE|nr:hypothetical protein CRE_28858 [Caenorhabditis remanei]
MLAKCFAAILLCTMMIGFSTQQVVVPAYYPSAYAYPSVYSPYLTAAAYPTVFAWGSNKNKGGDAVPAPEVPAQPSTLTNNGPTSA